MTVAPLGPNVDHGKRSRSECDKPRDRDGAQFSQLIKKRRGARGQDPEDVPDEAAAQIARSDWLFAMAQCRASTRVQPGIGAAGGGIPAVLMPRASESELFPQDVEVMGSAWRAPGSALTLRVVGGPWVGLELQASLHAGCVVMTLRPANRMQEKRLKEVRDALAERLREQTDAETRLEIEDAAE
jgi:hypothetical protein